MKAYILMPPEVLEDALDSGEAPLDLYANNEEPIEGDLDAESAHSHEHSHDHDHQHKHLHVYKQTCSYP